jgi:predicted NBD/HSP70 family sugar kinase
MRLSDQESNRLRVLKAIRRAEPVARTELVELTRLPRQVVSELVGQLAQRNLLLEERAPPSGRGRPRLKLRLNGRAATVVGAFLFPDFRLAVEIADLCGEGLWRTTCQLKREETLEALAKEIAAAVRRAVAAVALDRTTIHSIGLGLPAAVDGLRGVLHWLPGYAPDPVPFAAWVSGEVQAPVFLDSGANVLTRAEHWFGEDRQVDDFSLVALGLGIGLGQYSEGLLRTGDHGMSSQFAHVKVTPSDGPACVCGDHGCLMTYASMSGIVGRISEHRGLATPPGQGLTDAFKGFVGEAQAGDPGALAVFEFAGTALGQAIANYINVWDPTRIIVTCDSDALPSLIEASFRTSLNNHTVKVLRGRVPVRFRSTNPLAFAKGAAARVLEQLYRGRS